MALSNEEREFKKRLKLAKAARDWSLYTLNELYKTCPHRYRPLTKAELADEWMSVPAVCLICESHHGHRCKESLDGVCHYRNEIRGEVSGNKGKLELYDQKEVEAPLFWHEVGFDDCLYCGHPEERK